MPTYGSLRSSAKQSCNDDGQCIQTVASSFGIASQGLAMTGVGRIALESLAMMGYSAMTGTGCISVTPALPLI